MDPVNMNKRVREDTGSKYLSGIKKRAVAKAKSAETAKVKGALNTSGNLSQKMQQSK